MRKTEETTFEIYVKKICPNCINKNKDLCEIRQCVSNKKCKIIRCVNYEKG